MGVCVCVCWEVWSICRGSRIFIVAFVLSDAVWVFIVVYFKNIARGNSLRFRLGQLLRQPLCLPLETNHQGHSFNSAKGQRNDHAAMKRQPAEGTVVVEVALFSDL